MFIWSKEMEMEWKHQKKPCKIKCHKWPVAKSRGESLPWEQAVRAASTTNGTASRISHAGKFGLREASSLPGPEELLKLLPEFPGVTARLPPLFIFLNIMFRRLSTIWWTGVPWTRPVRGDAIQAWCWRYQTFNLEKESTKMGWGDDDPTILENRLLLFRSLGMLLADATCELRRSRRYSGVSWDPTGAPFPSMWCSRGGWLNCHNLIRRINAFEKTVWAVISSPRGRVREMFGTQDPKASQIPIRAPASSGTWQLKADICCLEWKFLRGPLFFMHGLWKWVLHMERIHMQIL